MYLTKELSEWGDKGQTTEHDCKNKTRNMDLACFEGVKLSSSSNETLSCSFRML
jgi:hypothetical protein